MRLTIKLLVTIFIKPSRALKRFLPYGNVVCSIRQLEAWISLRLYRVRERKWEFFLKGNNSIIIIRFGHFLVPLESPVYLLSESYCLILIASEYLKL